MKSITRIAAATICGALTLGAAMSAIAADIEDATPTPAPILNTDIGGRDLTFLTDTAHQIALLAQISELASKQAVTPEVQTEAATVAKEQADALAALQKIADGYHVPLDTDLDGDGTKLLTTLQADKGPKFDKSYLDAQADAAQALAASLTAGATSSDPGIKAFAQTSLTQLKAEQERVRKLGF
jgi:putative membrane protein